MTPRLSILLIISTVFALLSSAAAKSRDAEAQVTPFSSHGFDDIRVFMPPNPGKHRGVLIFLRPDWLGAEAFDVSRRFAQKGQMVILLDGAKFHLPDRSDHRQCASYSDCLVALSAWAQRQKHYSENQLPSLLTIGDSGRWAEKAWHEAPGSAFAAIHSVDYCPQTKTTPAMFNQRHTRWTIIDSPGRPKSCDSMTAAFLSAMDIERVTIAVNPRLRTGPMIQWVSGRLQSLDSENARVPSSINRDNVDDLQTLILEPEGAKTRETAKYDSFAVVYSGDGGWAEFTDELAESLTKHGLPVVGINSMRYFWRAKSPEQGAKDLERILAHYSKRWGARKVHLFGFSFGAGVLPFFARRLPEARQKQIQTLAMLAPYRKADFEFFLTDWFFDDNRGSDVLPEITKIAPTIGPKPICIYPIEEKKESLCTQDAKAPMKAFEFSGGHHFGGEVDKIVKTVFPEG